MLRRCRLCVLLDEVSFVVSGSPLDRQSVGGQCNSLGTKFHRLFGTCRLQRRDLVEYMSGDL